MKENHFKVARDRTSDLSYKEPNTYVQARVFDDSLKKFFDEQERHGVAYFTSNCDGVLLINLSAFTKGLLMIFEAVKKGTPKTITAEYAEKMFTLTITIDGEPPTRRELAAISKVMFMAGFELSSYDNVIQLSTELSRRMILSLYQHEVNDIYGRLYLEFMFL